MKKLLQRPPIEAIPAFYQKYVNALPKGDLFVVLQQQLDDLIAQLEQLTPEQWAYRYDEGKWSAKQVIGHVTDTERIFAYRALAFARGEQQSLPGFDEQLYVANGQFDEQSADDLIAQLRAVRVQTLLLFQSFDPSCYDLEGEANGNPMTLLALLYITAGHFQHHMAILNQRYFTTK